MKVDPVLVPVSGSVAVQVRAEWRRPYGPRRSINCLDGRPVVQVACCDAEAYARLTGKDLPTEAEWEFAARFERRRTF